MHFVSLLIGLSVAFGAALTMGGWRTQDVPGSGRALAVAPAMIAQPQVITSVSTTPAKPGPSVMLIVIRSAAQQPAAEERYGGQGWDLEILVDDGSPERYEALKVTQAALMNALGMGRIKDLRIVDGKKL